MTVDRAPCPDEGTLIDAAMRGGHLPTELERHLSECTRCRGAVTGVRRLRAAGERWHRGGADLPDPSGLWRVGMARRRLRREEETARRRAGRLRLAETLAGALPLSAAALAAWRLAEGLAGLLPPDPSGLVPAVAIVTATLAALATVSGLLRMRRDP